MKIKVCGITSVQQLRELDEMNIDFAGLIFFPGSPRYIGSRCLTGQNVKSSKLNLQMIGVFVNAGYEEIMKQVDAFNLDLVQLHGEESPDLCARIGKVVPIIKAFAVSEDTNIQSMISPFSSCVETYLFDTKANSHPGDSKTSSSGGTGKKFDWNKLAQLDIDKAFFLSGGIAPTDAAALVSLQNEIRTKDSMAIDINSRFETVPGTKNMELVRHFKQELSSIGPNNTAKK